MGEKGKGKATGKANAKKSKPVKAGNRPHELRAREESLKRAGMSTP